MNYAVVTLPILIDTPRCYFKIDNYKKPTIFILGRVKLAFSLLTEAFVRRFAVLSYRIPIGDGLQEENGSNTNICQFLEEKIYLSKEQLIKNNKIIAVNSK